MKKVQVCRSGFFCLFLSLVSPLAMARNEGGTSATGLVQGQSCRADDKVRCQGFLDTITRVWATLQTPISPRERAELRLKLNHALESYQALAAGAKDVQLQALDEKYQALQSILQTSRRFSFADSPDIAYHHLEMKAVKEVMDRFGQLELNPADVSSKDQPAWQTKEVTPPWAGYWYPRYDAVLYSGDQSVFAKVDRMMSRIGRESKAQELEALQNGGYPESWEGLCNAWSNASILEPEPKTAIEVLGERLSISDQKALFTKLYEGFPVTMYGIRYDGDFVTDGTYQDIRPEAFHQIALTLLGSWQKPFIIDDTAGSEVWQQPVFKVDWAMQEDEEQKDAYRVSMRLWKIKMRSQVAEDLTTRNDWAFDQYQYRLFVNPEIKAREGRLVVIAGEWLGNSRKNHPDYVVMPQDNGWPSTYNTWLQNNMDPLLALLRHPAQFFESE
ncbi:MAG TPA: hypothetical protein VFO10_25845 [Oligoflexus sp.]|uniref:hypothetical protein n=1 Tax=Oligoflexus sp. TaxID=1971216 RepID=UPI002D7FD92B|nr:hypothetical protein [Oligoflexus sp.]HET9240713.1 hypothetical protein [Oligoflexus sp.]